MLTMKQRRPVYRSLQGWAIGILLEAGAIKLCDEHGYMQCRGDPHARERACDTARNAPYPGCSVEDALAAVHDVLGSIGDACPDCR